MRKIHLLLFLSIFLILSQNTYAQKKYASTFLWKISGNGLTKPSYMYGTMHLQDKALFNLGDSIYAALEKVDGFSMEVDPVALMDAMLKTINDKDESPLLKDFMEEKKLKKYEKNIESKFGVTADKLTLKKLKKYILNKANTKKEGQMKTFMDMYLYKIAVKQNKKFAPVEDVEDQLSLMETYSPKSIEKFLETDSVGEEKYIQDFKSMYIQKNLTALAKMIEEDKTETYSDLALVKRNIKMARRIDSLTKKRTSFIAIGAAHLPGDSGLIKLLQNKGFTIEPVLSNKNIKPEEYKYKAAEKDWINIADEGGLVNLQMPIEPTSKKVKEGMDMKMSIDLTDYSLYGFMAVNNGTIITDFEKKSENMMDYYKKIGFEVLSNKQISQNGAKGIEFIGKENNEYIYRIRVLFKEKTMALLICGAQNKKYLYDENFERFFNSIKFTENVKPKEWMEFVNEENRYSIQMPKKPELSNDTGKEDASTIFTYTAQDETDGASYLCQTVVPKVGFYFPDDSTYYSNYKIALNENTKNGVQYFSPATLNNKPAMHFAANLKEDAVEIVMHGYIFREGNNFQILMAVTSKETADYPNVSAFFNSYKTLPFKKTEWNIQEIKEIGISVKTPSTFIKRQVQVDITSSVNEKRFLSEDKNTATTFYVDADSITSYKWYKNDSTFYRLTCNSYSEYEDSLISFSFDSVNYKADILFKLKKSGIYKKAKMVVNGNKIYTLFSYFPEQIMNGENEKKYFEEFNFTTKQKPTIFENRIKLLTDSLASKDSFTTSITFDALSSNSFTKSDLPYLHNALLKDYIKFEKAEENYRTMNVASKIKTISDTSTISFIADNYRNTNTTDDMKTSMIDILASLKTEKSYVLLKSLLLNNGLKSCINYNFSYFILDSLKLTKTLFPEVTALYKDTLLGGTMIKIVNELLDSSLITNSEALQNANGILDYAAYQIMVIKRDKNDYLANIFETIKMLGRVNNKQANELLQKYAVQKDMWTQELAIVQLLKNNIPVLPATILKIAADKLNRTSLYEDLKKVGREKYFPKIYLTQQKFAEAYLYELLTAEYELENPTLTFIGEKISKVNGTEKRFFLYKVKNVDEGEVTYTLGIMGGFDKDIKKISLEYDDQQYNYEYEVKFNAATVTKQYNDFIKDLNDRIKKNQ